MNKNLVVALGLAVLATPAFATKARLQALGEDSYGSFYVNDNRNIWLNAAQINNHKNLATYEFGGTVDTDNAATPRGEGGVNWAQGNLVYGVHFGGASNTSNNLRIGAGQAAVTVGAGGALTGATGTSSEENNVDVFVGGDAGMKWGANLGYARASDVSANPRSESMRTRLGVISGDTQVYANINLINNSKGTLSGLPGPLAAFNGPSTFEGKLGYQVGAIQAWNGNTLFVDYRQFEAEGQLGTRAKADQGIKQLQAGIGHVERLNDKTQLYTKASYVMASAENDNALAAVGAVGNFGGACELSPYFCKEYKTSRVPVVIGLETEATSWLTLRASVTQVVWGSEEDQSTERSVNVTSVNAGATLKFGELSIDGVVGNTAADGTFTNAASTNVVGGSGSNGTLRTDNLMTRVGMTYRF
jgi:hypothetical protein